MVSGIVTSDIGERSFQRTEKSEPGGLKGQTSQVRSENASYRRLLCAVDQCPGHHLPRCNAASPWPTIKDTGSPPRARGSRMSNSMETFSEGSKEPSRAAMISVTVCEQNHHKRAMARLRCHISTFATALLEASGDVSAISSVNLGMLPQASDTPLCASTEASSEMSKKQLRAVSIPDTACVYDHRKRH